MKVKIVSRYCGGKVLFEGEYKSLRNGLMAAVKSRADLYGADLYGADLSGANLSRANLSRADLSGANLSGANLYRAKNCNKYITTPLYGMLDQLGKIRAYKLVTAENEGPQYGGIKYQIGKTVKEPKANADENQQCAAGISLATLDWCIKEWRQGFKILLCEFDKKDIAAIPIGSDGKFRVKKCKIVRSIKLDKIGIKTK